MFNRLIGKSMGRMQQIVSIPTSNTKYLIPEFSFFHNFECFQCSFTIGNSHKINTLHKGAHFNCG